MVGSYNVYNYLTAIFLVHNLGINLEDIINVTDKLRAPDGRMEKNRI